MSMSTFNILLVLGMLFTGSLNTLTTNYADDQSAAGDGRFDPPTIWGKLNPPSRPTPGVHSFDHPFLQGWIMFMGESLCMLAYYVSGEARRLREVRVSNGVPKSVLVKEFLVFCLPACCDVIGTSTMYAGLCLSYPSVYQMLRACCVVFTALISHFVLLRRQKGYQWFSVLMLVLGVLIVGYVSLSASNDLRTSKAETSVLIGNCLIVFAQLIVAVQMCVEEKIMGVYDTHPLRAVGAEGLWGVLILGILLVPMYWIRVEGAPIENAPDGIAQMSQNLLIPAAMTGNLFSIAFFNCFGISVTKSLSAAHRMVLDSVRTILVWSVSLLLGWEQFHALQLLGFALLTFGTMSYSDVFRLPGFAYPVAEGAAAPALLAEPDMELDKNSLPLGD